MERKVSSSKQKITKLSDCLYLAPDWESLEKHVKKEHKDLVHTDHLRVINLSSLNMIDQKTITKDFRKQVRDGPGKPFVLLHESDIFDAEDIKYCACHSEKFKEDFPENYIDDEDADEDESEFRSFRKYLLKMEKETPNDETKYALEYRNEPDLLSPFFRETLLTGNKYKVLYDMYVIDEDVLDMCYTLTTENMGDDPDLEITNQTVADDMWDSLLREEDEYNYFLRVVPPRRVFTRPSRREKKVDV